MKILLINNDKGWSGGQEHLKDLASDLTRRGNEIHFVVREGSKSDQQFRKLGLSVHSLPGHGFGDVKALFQLVQLLRQERFDIVSVNREHDLFISVLAWHMAFPLHKPGKLMMSYHTATTRKQLLLGSVDAILCISEHVRTRLLQGNPAVAGKVSVIYYGIALGPPPAPEKFDHNRPRRYFKCEGFPLIGMVGEFWKNQGELIGMIPALRKSFPEVKVVFVGDNTDDFLITPIMAQIRYLGLEDAVIFTGRVPRELIPDIFYDLDLSVTTHRNEGFGIVHLESLAAGTPVVTYDEGGMVDIFRNEDVGVVVSGGSAEFTTAVSGLLGDNERRYRLGRNGYNLVERQYSLTDMGRRYLEYYDSIQKKGE
jgi:glycosyltransferase involved in cell wall biosynthesis